MNISINYKNSLKFCYRYFLRDNSSILSGRLGKLRTYEESPNHFQSNWVAEMILRTLRYSVKNIPFYSNFQKLVSQANKENVVHIIQQLPVITKRDLLDKKNSFYPRNGKSIWWSVGKTSGTTGTPLEVYRDYNSILYETSFIRRHWQWSGFKHRDKRATLRGDIVVPVDRSKTPFWFYNFFDNQLLISSRHLQDQYLPWIVDKLEAFSPKILEAYPSTAYELAKYLDSSSRKINIQYVYTGSEILYDHQRELIEKSLNAHVMDFYGMAERVAFASQCKQGNMHLNTDYSFVEILDENNMQTKGRGFITGTTFHNLSMPLVRYKLSDIAKFSDENCTCGCNFPLIESIQGKFEDILYGGSGNPVSPSVLTFAFKGLKYIKRSQVAQIEKSKWEIRVVPDNKYSEEESNKLVENIKTMVDSSVRVSVKIVPEIDRTAAGKYRWVVNEWYTKEKFRH